MERQPSSSVQQTSPSTVLQTPSAHDEPPAPVTNGSDRSAMFAPRRCPVKHTVGVMILVLFVILFLHLTGIAGASEDRSAFVNGYINEAIKKSCHPSISCRPVVCDYYIDDLYWFGKPRLDQLHTLYLEQLKTCDKSRSIYVDALHLSYCEFPEKEEALGLRRYVYDSCFPGWSPEPSLCDDLKREMSTFCAYSSTNPVLLPTRLVEFFSQLSTPVTASVSLTSRLPEKLAEYQWLPPVNTSLLGSLGYIRDIALVFLCVLSLFSCFYPVILV